MRMAFLELSRQGTVSIPNAANLAGGISLVHVYNTVDGVLQTAADGRYLPWLDPNSPPRIWYC